MGAGLATGGLESFGRAPAGAVGARMPRVWGCHGGRGKGLSGSPPRTSLLVLLPPSCWCTSGNTGWSPASFFPTVILILRVLNRSEIIRHIYSHLFLICLIVFIYLCSFHISGYNV